MALQSITRVFTAVGNMFGKRLTTLLQNDLSIMEYHVAITLYFECLYEWERERIMGKFTLMNDDVNQSYIILTFNLTKSRLSSSADYINIGWQASEVKQEWEQRSKQFQYYGVYLHKEQYTIQFMGYLHNSTLHIKRHWIRWYSHNVAWLVILVPKE